MISQLNKIKKSIKLGRYFKTNSIIMISVWIKGKNPLFLQKGQNLFELSFGVFLNFHYHLSLVLYQKMR